MLFSITLHAQIPIKDIESEIKNLKSTDDFTSYWNNLKYIDQEILLNIYNREKYDSLSLELMVKTANLFKIHGSKVYKKNNTMPILNFSHCYVGDALLAFLPIIFECKKVGGVIEDFGGKYPNYLLECLSITYYKYSLINQDTLISFLFKKINKRKTKNKISESILKIFEKHKKYNNLKTSENIGKWYNQEIKNTNEESFFEIIKMDDQNIYIKNKYSIHKLNNLTKISSQNQIYQIENEPFGWYYELDKNGNLYLKNENDEVLIKYDKFN